VSGARIGYDAWLRYPPVADPARLAEYRRLFSCVAFAGGGEAFSSAASELERGLSGLLGVPCRASVGPSSPNGAALPSDATAVFGLSSSLVQSFPEESAKADSLGSEGFVLRSSRDSGRLVLVSASDRGLLYGVFRLLSLVRRSCALGDIDIADAPKVGLRMLDHWDNFDGSVERGYAGASLFFSGGRLRADEGRLRADEGRWEDYARLLASVGINAICPNNVNVHAAETRLISEEELPSLAALAAVLRRWGIKLYLSVNFASPMELDGLDSADPLDPAVADFWKRRAELIHSHIADFGGFVVKADSEHRPGPFTYGRDHAQGANMLARALEPYGGLVIWRCFVYNCMQDWRDRSIDRARAAYDHFLPLDGRFADNVVLQIKNGPVDFQAREPVSPLFGALEATNMALELQATQEYTGQQRHLCFLVPQWREYLDFKTYTGPDGEGSPLKRIIEGRVFKGPRCAMAAVANTGDSDCWTGHPLAQANLYGFGRLAWDPDADSGAICSEWIDLSFDLNASGKEALASMLLSSWSAYENYTAPLGVGWMVNPNHHYGPNVDGYEYSPWGTYHYADREGVGVDRTRKTGSGYAGQYRGPNAELYESLSACPDELLLFFHHVPYSHRLHSGKSVIQHIYDSHFEGVEAAERFRDQWDSLKPHIDGALFELVAARLREQVASAREWRDQINTYFYRKSGVLDEKGRKIYP
jgi:alpha-glucuronidase